MDSLYDEVKPALSFISSDCPRDEWFKILCSIYDALGQDGYELAKNWSMQSPKFNQKDFDSTWRSIKPGAITKSTLFDLAYKNGMPRPVKSEPVSTTKKESGLSQSQDEPPDFGEPPIDYYDSVYHSERAVNDSSESSSHIPSQPIASVETTQNSTDDAAKRANVLKQWNELKPYNPSEHHAYLRNKELIGYKVNKLNGYEVNLRTGYDEKLGAFFAYPLLDLETREIVGFNRISTVGKMLGKDSKKSGNAGIIGILDKSTAIACICEGLADGLHIHHATGYATLVANDVGNITNVAKRVRKLYPQCKIVICADNDDAGRKGAIKAIKGLTNAVIAYPINKDFSDDGSSGLDISESIQKAIKNNQSDIVTVPKRGFWRIKLPEGGKGEPFVEFTPIDYIHALSAEGFCRVFPEHEKGITPPSILCRNVKNRLQPITTEVISEFVKKDLLNYGNDNGNNGGFNYYIFNAVLHNVDHLFNEKKWLIGLNYIDKPFHKDSKTSSFVYYRNCYIEVTANSIIPHDYSELEGVIWQDSILDRDFSILPKENFINCEFARFQYHNCLSSRNPTEKDKESAKNRLKTIRSAIGYLMHRYKTSSEIRAVIFNDEKISLQGNEGRTGKGINMHAVSHIRNVTWLDGKTFKFDDKNRFQSLTPATDVVLFDDISKKFTFELLYSILSEGYTKENKFKDSLKLLQAIKTAVTTNHVISGDSASDIGRKFELEISPYYDVDFSPKDEFGHSFFDDWDADEWLKFDNYMLYCLQYFLANGLVSTKHVNLIERKLIQGTAPEFIEFADLLERDTRLDKKAKFNEFITEYPDFSKFLKQRTFSTWLEMYAKARGLMFKGTESHGKGYFTLVTTNITNSEITNEVALSSDEQRVVDLLRSDSASGYSKGLTPHDVSKSLGWGFEGVNVVLKIRKSLQSKGIIEEVPENNEYWVEMKLIK